MIETARLLKEKKLTVAAAESCTGGLVSHLLTNIPGSSEYYVGGVIAYSNSVKISLLGVHESVLKECGAVSREVVIRMAEGIRVKTGADLGIGITGIAGPGGGTAEKPTGLVFIGVASDDGDCLVEKHRFRGGRVSVKRQSASMAISMLRRVVGKYIMRPPAAIPGETIVPVL